MLSQDDIDSVLRDAQSAVDDLVQDVATLTEESASTGPPAVNGPQAPATPTQSASPWPAGVRTGRVGRILALRVPVVVRLAEQRMKVNEVIKIVPGTILEFDRRCDMELDLMVNNRQIGSGVAVKVDEHFGLRITYVGDAKHRLDSLTG